MWMSIHQSEQRLNVLETIKSLVASAVQGDSPVRAYVAAQDLRLKFPECGMTVRQIQDEIIRQVGLARGVAEFGLRKGRIDSGGKEPDMT